MILGSIQKTPVASLCVSTVQIKTFPPPRGFLKLKGHKNVLTQAVVTVTAVDLFQITRNPHCK